METQGDLIVLSSDELERLGHRWYVWQFSSPRTLSRDGGEDIRVTAVTLEGVVRVWDFESIEVSWGRHVEYVGGDEIDPETRAELETDLAVDMLKHEYGRATHYGVHADRDIEAAFCAARARMDIEPSATVEMEVAS